MLYLYKYSYLIFVEKAFSRKNIVQHLFFTVLQYQKIGWYRKVILQYDYTTSWTLPAVTTSAPVETLQYRG